MKKYDYVIIGAGLFGAVFAYLAKKENKKCLVIEKREHIGGNIYCENIRDINVHKYGAHIFHTSNKEVWDFVCSLVEFNNYINSPIANYKGELFNLPFNMNTFYQLWKVKTPKEAQEVINKQKAVLSIVSPSNLEEQAISLVGTDIYNKLIKDYTSKQWGRDPKKLPAFIIKRLPLRFTFDNNYFNDRYQGIPIGGYNKLIEKLLDGVECRLNTDFYTEREKLEQEGSKIVFTGMIDEFYGFCHGQLAYRSLKFEHDVLEESNYQGNAVVNYTDKETPYTRVIEHKHFEFGTQPSTVITREYSMEYAAGMEPYYPVNDELNSKLYAQYKEMADNETNIVFGGRLAEYKYYDMDKVIERAFAVYEQEKLK